MNFWIAASHVNAPRNDKSFFIPQIIMTLALLDILTGKFANDQSIENIDNEQALTLSIISHLTRLLNARRGSLSHLPDYGLPDISQIYQELPYSIHKLTEAIKQTIEKYEPRLTQVQIIAPKSITTDGILQLQIRAIANDRHIAFNTYLNSQGETKITE